MWFICSLTFQTHYQSENCCKYITLCKTIGPQSVVKNLKLRLDHIFLYLRSLLDLWFRDRQLLVYRTRTVTKLITCDYLTKDGDYIAEWQKKSVHGDKNRRYHKLIKTEPPVVQLEIVHFSLCCYYRNTFPILLISLLFLKGNTNLMTDLQFFPFLRLFSVFKLFPVNVKGC